MRILHVTSSKSAAGGAERLLLDMARHHDRDAFSFAYCNLFFGGTFVDALRAAGEDVTVIEGGVLSVPRIVMRLVSLLRRTRPDVVHTHTLPATVAGQLAATIARVPVRMVTRHYTDDLLPPARRPFEHLAVRRATHVVAVSEAVAANLRAAGVAANAITVVHNGIDLARFDAEAARGIVPPWPEEWSGAMLIGSVGNLHGYKGYDVLLRAFALVAREEPRVRLVVIGDGAERAALTALARELGIAHAVAFPGRSTEVPALLPSFAIYVQPSRSESFGIAVAEAMAARRAVVATTAGGLPELVGDAGLLVPPDDPDALAAAVRRVVRDPNEGWAMGERARIRVETNFSIEVTVRQTETLYRRLARASCA